VDTRTRRGVDSLERAFELLNAFRDGQATLSLAELARRTGINKSTILRLAVSLERYGYLARVQGGFALGGTLYQLGSLYRQTFRLAEAVRPALEHLAAHTRESASFWIAEDGHRVCLCRVESTQSVRDALFREGDRLELDNGPTSTLLRAYAGAKGKRYDDVRRDSAAVSLGLYRAEVAGIACPVFSNDGFAGAVTLTGPRQRFDERALVRMRPAVRDAAAQITRLLGGDRRLVPAL
jgi:DNA-binding IclR family transcriptional regulator